METSNIKTSTTITKTALFEHFSNLEDPRIERTKLHPLINIITIAICAVIGGADSWVEMESFGKAKKEWFRTFLDLTHGIPSHDTFARVFAALDPEQIQQCFLNWIESVSQIIPGQVVPIDGKTLRHSFDKGKDKGAIHMVSAWASANHMVLGQIKVDEKSNEITAIPELLKILELKGCIVTIDAMGCQKEIAKKIIEKGADYVLALKGNQGNLYEDARRLYEHAKETDFADVQYNYYQTVDEGHGRHEIRRYWMLSDVERLNECKKWTDLNSIGIVESERCIGEKTTIETRYYISSLKDSAEVLADAVRSHWGIENGLHWILDMAFREDDCRVRKDNAPQNFAVLRHIALNLLKQNKSKKCGVRAKRLTAGWDVDYLAEVLCG